jgi:D-alanine-D-alanine ligase
VIIEAGIANIREVNARFWAMTTLKPLLLAKLLTIAIFMTTKLNITEGLAGLKIPAPLPPEVSDRLREMAIQAFRAVDASELSRVDFFYVESTGDIFINEINTLPGFTTTSMYPRLWDATGIPFAELVHQLIQFARKRGNSGQHEG